MFKWKFPRLKILKKLKAQSTFSLFDLALFVIIFLYGTLTFNQVSFFNIFSALINLNIWNLFSLNLGIMSGLLVFMLTIYIAFSLSSIKQTLNHNLIVSLLILLAFTIALITNIHIITLPPAILFIILASLYINLILSVTSQKPLIEILAYIIFFPFLVLLYKGWVILIAFKNLGQKEFSKINKFAQKSIWATYVILILGIAQVTLYFLSLVNPLLKDYIYLPLKPVINQFLLNISIYFSITSIIGLLLYIHNFKIFETNVNITQFLQNIYKKISNHFIVIIIQYILLIIGLIYNLTNIITLALFRIGKYQLDISFSAFVYRTLIINTLILGIIVLYWMASLKTKTSNKFRKLIHMLGLLTLINSIYAFLALFLEYNVTVNRLILFIITLIVCHAIVQVIKNTLSDFKTSFIYLSTLLGYFTPVILIIPWWQIVLLIWQFLPSHYKNFTYWYTKSVLPYTITYNIESKFKQINFKNANIYSKVLLCNKDKSDYDWIFQPYNIHEPSSSYPTLFKALEQASQNDNLMAKTIVKKITEYTPTHCHKLNTLTNKLIKVLLLKHKICKTKHINCTLFKPQLDYIHPTKTILYFKNAFVSNTHLYDINLNQIYEVQAQIVFNQETKSFYWYIDPKTDIIPAIDKPKPLD